MCSGLIQARLGLPYLFMPISVLKHFELGFSLFTIRPGYGNFFRSRTIFEHFPGKKSLSGYGLGLLNFRMARPVQQLEQARLALLQLANKSFFLGIKF